MKASMHLMRLLWREETPKTQIRSGKEIRKYGAAGNVPLFKSKQHSKEYRYTKKLKHRVATTSHMPA